MQSEEQKLIDSLFSRLQQAETQSGPRDPGAEQLIKNHLQNQPAAAYYMSQALLIQEAALKKLNDQVAGLETRLQQLQQQQQPQSSGGFLAGLFGGGNSQQRQQAPAQSAWGNPQQAPQQPQQQPAYTAPPAAGRTTGFLGGALQTAAGVAGGVVLADMLTSMFHHSQPEEIVNIINEAPPETPDYDQNLDTFNYGSNEHPADNASWDDNNNGGGFDSFFGDNSFNDDDDSFL
ncbi:MULTISPECIES: DUF2076 domain-containing protein [Tatumella]|uniref:DUF2076 domain-containing protein n=1 Tax=Tatumella punctata TaxID=399969 RepID=A0ABW1VQZ6_9GAMM|nr:MULTISPECIES: DUF2076 domain-containing protein [unclassified Tatumella]MBS0856817.1 DUF2076 domain-containing protein [Tatumella sp. JGM16]MBS0875718.1 DUF2076 domain-containing protein [Tatumella sp. JGM82]MBS0890123.1 DUF2076 domain-containing protein [Tatumella sp. JGM94]MBS0893703.1 DUF2076 domain-containing protein [Tatumella sp. JGM130]MBS0900249.1 DUF2076 domain-containing protein [Tatumella sp. JGM100]